MQKKSFGGGYKPGGRSGGGGYHGGGGSSGGYSGGGGYRGGYNRDGFRPRYTGPNKNYFIRAPKILLIDAEGENRGEIDTQIALQMAKDAGLDLVEISPNANPPVCRIIDFSKYIYEQKKKKKLAAKKQQNKEMKEFKFSPVIEQHDIDMRVKRAKEFLAKGHNVRITIEKSRNRQTPDQLKAMMETIKPFFTDFTTMEDYPKFEGRKMFVTYKTGVKA